MKLKNLSVFCLALICAEGALLAKVRPARIFTDNMVLQANSPIRIWGSADKGEKVTVEFLGTSASAIADNRGFWRVNLAAQNYVKKGVNLKIQGTNTIVFKDVLVGEVWLGSGQSNMQFPLRHVNELHDMAKDPKNVPQNIRFFLVETCGAPTPNDMHTLPKNAKWLKYEAENYEITKEMSVLLTLFSQRLNQELDVPVGVIAVGYGASCVEAWDNEKALIETGLATPTQNKLNYEREQHDKAIKEWEENGKSATYPTINYNGRPATAYNAMINPLIPYSIRGLLWYQGEGNEGNENYMKYFLAYANMMREVFENPDMPIYTVQLPDMNNDNWPKMREVQRKLADMIPNSGIAITIDGHEIDLHPKDKRKVADRLLRMALADVYGKDIVDRSPMPENVSLSGEKVIVEFRHTYGGLKSKDGSENIRCFELAGSDKNFVSATAKIASENTVEITIPDGVSAPKYVHYAWSADPDVNLYNSGDLPASPFEEAIE